MKRTDFFTKEQALEKTDGGRDVFIEILGEIPNKKISSPLRDDGKVASFEIFCREGIYFFKDYGGNGDFGDCITFLMKLNNWNFGEALQHIKNSDYAEIKQKFVDVKKTEKRETLIEFSDMPFQDKHRVYWDKYSLDETFLNQNEVYAVRQWAINKKVIKVKDDRCIFAYYASDIDKCKILQVGKCVLPDEKWFNNVPNNYLWFLKNYSSKVDIMFVCKSVKDALVLKKLGYNAIAVQNESARTMLSNNVEKIKNIATFPVVTFGTDDQGKQQSIEITKQTGWKWFNTPNFLYKEQNIEDPADFVEKCSYTELNTGIKNKIKLWGK